MVIGRPWGRDIEDDTETDMAKRQSALRGLVQKVKRSASAPLIPKIEAFLMKAGREDQREPDGYFHPSAVSYKICPRLEVMARDAPNVLGPQPQHPATLIRIFWLGHALHSLYQDRILGPAGLLWGRWANRVAQGTLTVSADLPGVRTDDMVQALIGDGAIVEGFWPGRERPGEGWRYVEPVVKWPAYDIIGRTDGIVTSTPWKLEGLAILDIKSINSQGYAFLQKVRAHHERQVQLYLHGELQINTQLPEITEGCILYVNKDSSEEKEFRFPKDEAKIKDTLQAIADTRLYLGKFLPSRIPECKTRSSARAAKCYGCSLCFKSGSGQTGWEALAAQERMLKTEGKQDA